MKIEVYLHKLNAPVVYDNAESSYQKGDFLCIRLDTGKVHKYPINDIFRVIEDYEEPTQSRQLLVEEDEAESPTIDAYEVLHGVNHLKPRRGGCQEI